MANRKDRFQVHVSAFGRGAADYINSIVSEHRSFVAAKRSLAAYVNGAKKRTIRRFATAVIYDRKNDVVHVYSGAIYTGLEARALYLLAPPHMKDKRISG